MRHPQTSTQTAKEHVSPSDRSIQILDDVKDPRRSHYIFKILLTGVEPAYQIAHPGEKDHTNVDRAAWISTFEEALAKTTFILSFYGKPSRLLKR